MQIYEQETKQFNPINLNIVIESHDELIQFLGALNCTQDDINANLNAICGLNSKYKCKDSNAVYSMYSFLKKQVIKFEL